MYRFTFSTTLCGVAAFALAAGSVHASVADYRSMVSNNTNLIHQWSFEGSGGTELSDSEGSATLEQATYGTVFNGVDFIQGFDSTTQAVQIKRQGGDRGGDGAHGAALRTTSDISYGNQLTVQALIRPDADNLTGEFGVAYIAAFRDASNRGYFMMQGGPGDDPDNINALVGGWNTANSLTTTDITPGNWYFVTNTFAYDSGENETTITSYVANLTAGDTQLTVITKTVDGQYPIGDDILTIGGLTSVASGQAGDLESAFPGAIDEMAIYNTVLDQSTIESQFSVIPEPASLVLMGIGGLLMLKRRRN